MKKTQKLLVALLAVLTVGVSSIGLSACDFGDIIGGGSDSSVSEIGGSDTASASDSVSESDSVSVSESDSASVSESESDFASDSDSEESSSEIIPDKESEGLEYTLSEDGTYYIWTGMGTCTDEHVVLPTEYEGLPVKAAGEFAAEYYLDAAIEFVVEVELGYELAEEERVYYKKMLKQELEDQGTYFVSTPIKSITFSDSIVEIAGLYGLEGLEKIHIGKNMILYKEAHPGEDIPDVDYARVSLCTDLKEITVSEEHENYIVIDGNVYAMLYPYPKALLLAVNSTISQGTVAILTGAFCNVTATEIVIPDIVTSIGSSAFANCSSLTEVVIPNSVTSIGSAAFKNCSSLTEVVIPDSVTSIGAEAFYGCSSLTEIVIPEGVTSIDGHAFANCSSLTSVTFENTEGWTVGYDNTAISSEDLADPAMAAEYLTETYCWYTWTQKEDDIFD